MDARLRIDALDVRPCGVLGDDQRLGDEPSRTTARQVAKDLTLATREVEASRHRIGPRGKHVLDNGSNPGLDLRTQQVARSLSRRSGHAYRRLGIHIRSSTPQAALPRAIARRRQRRRTPLPICARSSTHFPRTSAPSDSARPSRALDLRDANRLPSFRTRARCSCRIHAPQHHQQHESQRIDGRERQQRQKRQPVVGAQRTESDADAQPDGQKQPRPSRVRARQRVDRDAQRTRSINDEQQKHHAAHVVARDHHQSGQPAEHLAEKRQQRQKHQHDRQTALVHRRGIGMAHGQTRHNRREHRGRHEGHPHVHIAHDMLRLRPEHRGVQNTHHAHEDEQAQARLQQPKPLVRPLRQQWHPPGKRDLALEARKQQCRRRNRHDGEHAGCERSQKRRHRHKRALHDKPAENLAYAGRRVGFRSEHLKPCGIEHCQREAAQKAVQRSGSAHGQPRHHTRRAQKEPNK